MKEFINMDEDRMNFCVTANYSDFDTSKSLYKAKTKNEPICFSIEDYTGYTGDREVFYTGLSIEKTKKLIVYLNELVKYFDE